MILPGSRKAFKEIKDFTDEIFIMQFCLEIGYDLETRHVLNVLNGII